ncbi:MAG: hypothetical protein DRQ78_06315 [Epsilonproteobacteria bacterium]|nr:MAG: hypothetical protein DRQ78_06315 [Campylobacterota bacterium]
MKKILIYTLLLSYILSAENYRMTKPEAWKATSIKDAIAKLYGTSKTIDDPRVKVVLSRLAENGGSIPIRITTTIAAKSIAVFQNANVRALVTVFSVADNTIPDYNLRIKMSQTGHVTVVVEGRDGKLYSHTQEVDVSISGCGGGCGGASNSRPNKQAYRQYAPSRQVTQAYYTPKSTRPMPAPDMTTSNEGYNALSENTFKEVALSPLSTLSTDVDTASYANIRRYLFENKTLPHKDVVRIEEMLNYFDYHYAEPRTREPFAIHTRVGESLWNNETKLLQIGLQTKKPHIERLPASNLVFLLDVSGSMGRANKLPLLVKSLTLLVKELRRKDRVSIVVYAGSAGLVLDRARGDEKSKIINALKRLKAGGSTAGGRGINLAYEVAQEAFIEGGNNRIILATDGDFNVGPRSQKDLETLIEEKRKSGIYLTVLGFGMGNYKDNKAETLADKGNGNYAYIDTLLEAKKVLVTQMSGTLYTVAKDVKIQVEFNPAKVHSYRLIGYENRLLNDEDFKNDKIDAAEVGMGHSVTALYEIVMHSGYRTSKIDALKYQKSELVYSDELATVKIRYKHPEEHTSLEMQKSIHEDEYDIATRDYLFAQSVAGFGMLLKDSIHNKNLNYDKLIRQAKENKGRDEKGYRAEFIKMMEKAEILKGL